MPSHIKTYDRSEDPEDHLKIFQAAAKIERWAMTTWCHMFNSTLTRNARVWFDDLLNESIDSYDDLKKAFLENYLQQKKCIKDPIEIHNIKQRDDKESYERIWGGSGKARITRGKLSHLIKKLKQNNEKEQPKAAKKEESSGKDKVLVILMVQPWERVAMQKITQSFSPKPEIFFPLLGEDEGTEGPMIIEAEIGGHCIHCMYVDGGSASEILYEHCFRRLCLEIRNQLVPATTPLIGFSGHHLRTMELLENRSYKIISSSVDNSQNAEAPGRRRSITLKSSSMVPLKCAMVSGPESNLPTTKQTVEERIKLGINQEYPEQTIMIGSILTEEGRNKLCDLLQRNLDIFAWKPADMTGVPRHIAKHHLNVREGCSLVRQTKRGQAADRNQAIHEEVGKPVEVGIIKEVHYHDWLSNSVMVKKLDDSWRMCVDFKDLNKACPKDGYPLPEIDWKMPFGLRNAEATYQRLVDKAFHKQIGRNLEVYVDDLVIKSRTEDEIVRDIEETFKTLREINMKLNPKKCTFRVEEGMFLGYKVNTRELKVCPDKLDVVLTEEAFKQMKQLIAELPMLVTPMEKEELIVYLAAAKETVSAVLMTERETKQMPIYFVSRALRGPKINYTSMEKLVLALVHACKRLKRYFQAHSIIVITDQPIQQVLSRSKVEGRLQKWSIELGEYAIHYRPRVSVKGQILADFIVERPEEDSPNTLMEVEEELPEPWILFTDGSSYTDGFGAGLILINPEGMEFTYALRFRTLTNSFKAFSIRQVPRSENEKADALSKIASTSFAHLSKQVLVEELKEKSISKVEILAVVEEEGDTWMTPIFEYLTEETLPADVKKARAVRRKSRRFTVINGTLYKKSFLGPWLRCVGPLQANYVLREIHEGSYSMHAGTRSVVAKALRIGYYWPTMHKDARTLIRVCQDCQVHKPVPRNPQQKLTPITSPWLAIDYFTKWIEAKPVATITDNQIKKFVWDNIVCRFELPGEIILDNGKQFQDNLFKDCLGEGIKARLDARSKNWMEELSHVLWAHRTMIKSSNGDTLFLLTYGTKVVIPTEIGMPTLRTVKVDLVQNNEALEINLNLLEERREQVAIRYIGKLGPKWEGLHKVTEAPGKGAYKLRDHDGKQLPQT
ncbi:reverse transcriptase domain-containing protein [Tanacetum coccineum]